MVKRVPGDHIVGLSYRSDFVSFSMSKCSFFCLIFLIKTSFKFVPTLILYKSFICFPFLFDSFFFSFIGIMVYYPCDKQGYCNRVVDFVYRK